MTLVTGVIHFRVWHGWLVTGFVFCFPTWQLYSQDGTAQRFTLSVNFFIRTGNTLPLCVAADEALGADLLAFAQVKVESCSAACAEVLVEAGVALQPALLTEKHGPTARVYFKGTSYRVCRASYLYRVSACVSVCMCVCAFLGIQSGIKAHSWQIDALLADLWCGTSSEAALELNYGLDVTAIKGF